VTMDNLMIIALRVVQRTFFETEGPSSLGVSENAIFGNSYRKADLNEAAVRRTRSRALGERLR
jgi:hypothetical protein